MTSQFPQGDVVNWPDLLIRVDGDYVLLHELIALFEEEFPMIRERLQNAMDSGDTEEMRCAAHKLKGMLANLSFQRGVELATEIEMAARMGDGSGVPAVVTTFDREAQNFLPSLRTFLAKKDQ